MEDVVPKKKVKHVFVNWRKLLKELKSKYPERKVTTTKVALFLYQDEKELEGTLRKRCYYKASEFYGKSEFTLTELVNLCDYCGFALNEFVENYTIKKQLK